ncbi:MAG: metallopeptidase [Firmicutes bacterium]|nr:metallopeptidase [Bacillota bacterium]
MDVALCQLEFVPASGVTLATDGQNLFYEINWLLSGYRLSREKISRAYLHMVLHCIFHHPFASPYLRPDCWDLACDIAVENIITEMGLPQTSCSIEVEQRPVISQLKKTVKALTAERIYRHYLDLAMTEEQVAELRRLFVEDDHSLWTQEPDLDEPESEGDQADENQAGDGEQGSGGPGQSQADQGPADQATTDDDQSGPGRAAGASLTQIPRQIIREQWQAISERIEVDLDTISQQWGNRSGSLTQNINEVRRERVDYRDFLSRFMVLGEAMQVNDDEFDYVFYTHGFQLYKNMPLIEPLEYKDVRKMRDFVIAIDTSGSCSGELVQEFVNKTCAIFQQGENFFQSFNIHLLQCDSEIQSAVKLTRLEDVAGYLQTTRLHGFGGTDFRPVFRYVDEMIANKEFTNLKGLIYFTDGLGIFPQHKPPYEAAFVLLTDEGRNLAVPPWAIKLVLTEDDIKAL